MLHDPEYGLHLFLVLLIQFLEELLGFEEVKERVQQLNHGYYKANDLAQSLGYAEKIEVGVSAQQVQNVLPEIVVSAPIDEKYLTVHYERLVPLLIEAIKEQQNQINNLLPVIRYFFK